MSETNVQAMNTQTLDATASNPITRNIVAACRRAHACRAALEYLEASPRTVAELYAREPDSAQWLATCVPGLPEAMRDELHRLTGCRTSWRNGKLHRDDGPAIEWADGYSAFWREGKRHRDDGPAIEYPNGYREWWRDGVQQRAPGSRVPRGE